MTRFQIQERLLSEPMRLLVWGTTLCFFCPLRLLPSSGARQARHILLKRESAAYLSSARLPPNSDRIANISAGPSRAMCGRLRVGKSFLHACSSGRSSHVFGLLVRFRCPLPLTPSAGRAPATPPLPP